MSLKWAEDMLSDNKEFLVNNKLSLADYALFELLHMFECLSKGCFNSLGRVKAFYQHFLVILYLRINTLLIRNNHLQNVLVYFQKRPNIKKYLEDSKYKNIPFTNSGHF